MPRLRRALHWGCTVYVMTRNAHHRELARQLGAAWVGGSDDRPPEPLDSAILFAPVGNLVPHAQDAISGSGVLIVE